MWKRSAQSRRRCGSRGGEADTCRERTVSTHPLHTRTGSVYPRCGMRSRSVVHWPHISLPQCRQWWLVEPPHTNADRPAAPIARCNMQRARCNEWQACKVNLAACRHTRHATRIHVHAYMRRATYGLQCTQQVFATRSRCRATQTNAVVPTSAVPLLARSHFAVPIEARSQLGICDSAMQQKTTGQATQPKRLGTSTGGIGRYKPTAIGCYKCPDAPPSLVSQWPHLATDPSGSHVGRATGWSFLHHK